MSNLTKKQDAFALALVTEPTKKAALNKAYPKSKHWKINVQYAKASEMSKNDKIMDRVGYYQEIATDPAKEQLEDHQRVLRRVGQQSAKDKNYGAAVRAEELIGRTKGYYVERKEVKHAVRAMSDEEIVFALASQGSPLAAAEMARNVGLVGFNTEGDKAFINKLAGVNEASAKELCRLMDISYIDTLEKVSDSEDNQDS